MLAGRNEDSMNSGMPDQIEPGAETGLQIALQACGILLAAVVLGVVYNQSSPLGLRATSAEDQSASLVATPGAEAPPIPSVAQRGDAGRPQPVSTGDKAANLNPVLPSPPVPPNQIPVAVANPPQFPELKWPAVKALLAAKQIVLIDARLKETYLLSHIPGAVSLPAYSSPEELQAFAMKYPKDARLVLYCNSDTCDMSHELAGKLARNHGYTNLSVMPGGFAEDVIAEPGGATTAPP